MDLLLGLDAEALPAIAATLTVDDEPVPNSAKEPACSKISEDSVKGTQCTERLARAEYADQLKQEAMEKAREKREKKKAKAARQKARAAGAAQAEREQEAPQPLVLGAHFEGQV